MPPPPTAEVLLRERAWMLRLVAGLLGRDDADDLAQDVAVVALRQPPGHLDGVRGWLATVARRLAGRRRHRASLAAASERAAARPEAGPSAHDVVARAEVHRRVVDAVLALDEPYRTVVLLRFFDGRQPSDIAARLGCPVATVRTRLARATQRLHRALAERIGPPAAWPALLALPLREAAGLGAAVTSTGAVLMSSQAKTFLAAAAVLVLGVAALLWSNEPARGDMQEPTDIEPPVLAAELPTAPARVEPQVVERHRAATARATPASRPPAPASVLPVGGPGEGLLVYVHDERGEPVADARVWHAPGVMVLTVVLVSADEPSTMPPRPRLEVLGAVLDPDARDPGRAHGEAHPGGDLAPTAPPLVEALGPRLLARTDRGGVCRIPLRDTVRLVATTEAGLVSPTLQVDAGDPAQGFVALCVGEGQRVQGEVLGPEGERVREAAVQVVEFDPTSPPRLLPENTHVPTDPRGRFACVLPENGWFALAATSARLASSWELVGRRGSRSVTLRLRPLTAVQGQVLDPYGTPCREATVCAVLDTGPNWLDRCFSRASTGEDGRYRLESPDRTQLLLVATHPEYAPSPPVRVFVSDQAPASRADFRLQLWGEILGEVRWSDGRPIVGAKVTLALDVTQGRDADAAQEALPSGVVDAHGLYRIGRLRQDRTYRVVCTPDPTRPAVRSERRGVGTGNQSFTFEEAKVRGGRLRLRLVAPDGDPFQGAARVTLLPERSGPSWTDGVDVDARGDAALEGLPQGGRFRLEVVTGRYARQRTAIVTVAPDDVVVVPLTVACPLTVQLSFARGRPALGAVVTCQHAGPDPLSVSVRTDGRGVAVFPDLPAGRYAIDAALGSDRAKGSADLEPGATETVVLRLRR